MLPESAAAGKLVRHCTGAPACTAPLAEAQAVSRRGVGGPGSALAVEPLLLPGGGI